jgi:acyl dehydratase
MDVRFTAPVLPGDTIQTEVWLEPQGAALFRCKVVERNRVVIDNGFAEYETATPIGSSCSASH